MLLEFLIDWLLQIVNYLGLLVTLLLSLPLRNFKPLFIDDGELNRKEILKLKNKPLTPETLREYEGFGKLSQEDAERELSDISELCALLYESVTKHK